MRAVFIVDKHGAVVWPGERNTRQRLWVNAGSITAEVTIGEAPIDVDKRTDADIVALAAAKKVIYKPDDGTVAFEIRIRADGNADDALVIQMLAAAGIDHYTKVADLTCKQGTQVADDSAYFIDDFVTANSDWETSPRIVDAEDDYIARYILNTHGHDRFLFVCTDKQNATNVYIDVRRTA